VASPASFQGIVVWLGEATIPVDSTGRAILPKRLPQYAAQTLAEAKRLLESHGIRFIFIRERVWEDKLEQIIKNVKELSSGIRLVVLWSTPQGHRLSVSLNVHAVEDDPFQLLRFVRQGLELRYSAMSVDKARLIERLAYRTAARLEQLICDNDRTARRMILNQLQGIFSMYGVDDEAAEKDFRLLRTELGPMIPKILKNPRVASRFIAQLVLDVQNSYWVEIKSRLIDNKKCDYGSWGTFFVGSSRTGLVVTLSHATAMLEFNSAAGEIHAEPSFAEVLMWLSDNLESPLEDAGNQFDSSTSLNDVAFRFAKVNLPSAIKYAEMLSSLRNSPSIGDSEITGLGSWKSFGLQARAISYLGCLAFVYSLSRRLTTTDTVEFPPNGQFVRESGTVVFKPSQFFIDLLAANIPKTATATGRQ